MSARPVALACLLGAAVTLTAASQPPCGTWLACMSEAVAAAQKKEYERFHDLTWRSVQQAPPVHVPLLYLLARAQAQSGRPGDSVVTLARLAAMGVPTNARTQADFSAARAHPRWPEVERAMIAAAAPRETSEVAFRLAERDLVPEALAYDPRARRFLVGSLYRRKVVSVDAGGGTSRPFADHQGAAFDGVLGVKADPARGVLWVASAAIPEMEGFDPSQAGRSRLHRLDLRTGRALASYAPPGEGAHLLNDLVVSAGGDVYVTDSAAGLVHRLRAGAPALERFATIGANTYPNGIALDERRNTLYVASFLGISRVDVRSGALTPLTPSRDLALNGVDGLYAVDGHLVAVQNALPGVNRVVRFALDDAGGHAIDAQVYDSNLPDYDWPTTGVVVNGDFYYIASSQLRSFEAPGKILPLEKLKESVIRRLRLSPPARQR